MIEDSPEMSKKKTLSRWNAHYSVQYETARLKITHCAEKNKVSCQKSNNGVL